MLLSNPQMLSKRLVFWLAFVLGMWLWPAHPLTAQSQPIVVYIDWPNEGETLYAGPTSLLYSVPVEGHVTGREKVAGPVVVQLEIIQYGAVLSQGSQQLQEDGTFSFNVTVNPDASMGLFPTEQSGCIAACHFPSDLAFPAGPLTLRASVTSPADVKAFPAERQITVDRSTTAMIPVKVVLDDEAQTGVPGVKVSAATRLYLWRARHALAATNAAGIAHMQVEALHEAPSTYVLQVRPTVVDGILYESAEYETIEITLPPAAEATNPVTLTVHARQGQIEGKIIPASTKPLPDSIWAICLPDGESFQTHPEQDADFQFRGLPVDQYQLALAPSWLVANGHNSENVLLNLEESPTVQADLSLETTGAAMVSGRVVDENGDPLPFAWIAMEEDGRAERVLPFDGQYMIAFRPEKSPTLIVTAPGFYSRANVIGNVETGGEQVMRLSRRPDTRELTGNNGTILLPADSQFQVSGDQIRLEWGWLWGENESETPFSIQAGALAISLTQSRFALEYRPPERAWLYLPAGEALIKDERGHEILMTAGQMVNLLNSEGLKAVNYAPVAVQVLDNDMQSPVAAQWQPTLQAQIRDRLALIGISVAQIITFITYFLLLLSLLVAPLTILYLSKKRRHGEVNETKSLMRSEEIRG